MSRWKVPEGNVEKSVTVGGHYYPVMDGHIEVTAPHDIAEMKALGFTEAHPENPAPREPAHRDFVKETIHTREGDETRSRTTNQKSGRGK